MAGKIVPVVISETVCGYSGCQKKLKHYPEPKKLSCGHVRCGICFEGCRHLDGSYRCAGCNVVTSKEELDNQKVFLSVDMLEQWKRSQREFSEKEKEYECKIAEMKKKCEKARAGNVICMECGKNDEEGDIQVCTECFKDKIEKARQGAPTSVDIHSIAICAACAIRNHMKKGHDVTDYLPIAITYQNTVHQQVLKPLREVNVNESIDLKKSMDNMMNAIEEAEKELDRMVDMMRRSKTREFQQDFATKIGGQVQKNFGYMVELREHINNEEKKLNAMITKLEAENTSEEEMKCFEKVEKDSDSVA